MPVRIATFLGRPPGSEGGGPPPPPGGDDFAIAFLDDYPLAGVTSATMIDAVRLSDNRLLVTYQIFTDAWRYATVVLEGDEATWAYAGPDVHGTANTLRANMGVALDSTRSLSVVSDFGSQPQIHARVITTDGFNDSVMGATADLTSVGTILGSFHKSLVFLSTDKSALVFTNSAGTVLARVITTAGTGVTIGTAQTIDTTSHLDHLWAQRLSDNLFAILAFGDSVVIYIVSFDTGTGILTVVDEIALTSAQDPMQFAVMTPTKMLVAWGVGFTSIWGQVVEYDGADWVVGTAVELKTSPGYPTGPTREDIGVMAFNEFYGAILWYEAYPTGELDEFGDPVYSDRVAAIPVTADGLELSTPADVPSYHFDGESATAYVTNTNMGTVVLDNVGFAYWDETLVAIQTVNLDVIPGEATGPVLPALDLLPSPELYPRGS